MKNKHTYTIFNLLKDAHILGRKMQDDESGYATLADSILMSGKITEILNEIDRLNEFKEEIEDWMWKKICDFEQECIRDKKALTCKIEKILTLTDTKN